MMGMEILSTGDKILHTMKEMEKGTGSRDVYGSFSWR